MRERLNVILREHPYSTQIEIYVFSQEGNDEMILNGDIWTTFKLGDPIKPTILLPRLLLKDLMFALKNFGVTVPDESKTQGMYEAQNRHLEDLRILLRLNDAIPVQIKSKE